MPRRRSDDATKFVDLPRNSFGSAKLTIHLTDEDCKILDRQRDAMGGDIKPSFSAVIRRLVRDYEALVGGKATSELAKNGKKKV